MEFQSRIDDDDEDAVLLEVETHSMRIVDNDDDDPLDAYMKTIETPGNLAVTFPRELPRPRRQIPPNARLTKNRRYQKLQELLHKSDYFSDENMELRNPGLFHLLLGNYLPAQAESSRPTADQSKLSEFLLASIQKRDLEERKAQEEDLWGSSFRRKRIAKDNVTDEDDESAFEEEVDSSDEEDNDESAEDEDEMTIDERRAHLVDVMCQRFMQGMDVGFVKYDEIDANASFDLNDLAQRDIEDYYFNNDLVE